MNLSSTLTEWSRPSKDNLHSYRLKVKELRYVLDLGHDVDTGLRSALGETKNKIGEWHDWCVLENIARRILKNNPDFCRRIHSRADEKLDPALATATHLQSRHLRASD